MPILLLNGRTGITGTANDSFAPATLDALGQLSIKGFMTASFAPATLAAKASFIASASNESRAFSIMAEQRAYAIADENRYIQARVDTAVEA